MSYNYDYFDEIQQWYVAFYRRERPRFRVHHWLINNKFVHVILSRELPGGNTLVIDPQQWGIAVQIVEKPLQDYLFEQSQLPACTAMLGYTADYRRLVTYYPRGIFTCVSTVKAILGLWRCALVQSPFGLYKLLLKYPTTTLVKPFIPYTH